MKNVLFWKLPGSLWELLEFFFWFWKKNNQIVFILQLSSEIFKEDKMGSTIYFASLFTLFFGFQSHKNVTPKWPSKSLGAPDVW